MPRPSNWSWEQTLIAFRLYCRLPFGKLHQHNPEIIALAAKLGRTPSAVGMKACNFASLDPVQRARGIKGLANHSQFEQVVWDRFAADSESIAAEAEAAYEHLLAAETPEPASLPPAPVPPLGPTETEALVRVRRVQSFFRTTVLISYDSRCALTGLSVPALLNASHIIPWSASPHRRADPRNGLCLNALHDRAFDRGLITFDQNHRLILSPKLAESGEPHDLTGLLTGYAGKQLRVPARFAPDGDALAYHRERVFQNS